MPLPNAFLNLAVPGGFLAHIISDRKICSRKTLAFHASLLRDFYLSPFLRAFFFSLADKNFDRYGSGHDRDNDTVAIFMINHKAAYWAALLLFFNFFFINRITQFFCMTMHWVSRGFILGIDKACNETLINIQAVYGLKIVDGLFF